METSRIGIVSKYPFDAMHCLYLGFMRELLSTYSRKLNFYKEFVETEYVAIIKFYTGLIHSLNTIIIYFSFIEVIIIFNTL